MLIFRLVSGFRAQNRGPRLVSYFGLQLLKKATASCLGKERSRDAALPTTAGSQYEALGLAIMRVCTPTHLDIYPCLDDETPWKVVSIKEPLKRWEEAVIAGRARESRSAIPGDHGMRGRQESWWQWTD